MKWITGDASDNWVSERSGRDRGREQSFDGEPRPKVSLLVGASYDDGGDGVVEDTERVQRVQRSDEHDEEHEHSVSHDLDARPCLLHPRRGGGGGGGDGDGDGEAEAEGGGGDGEDGGEERGDDVRVQEEQDGGGGAEGGA